MLEQSNIITTVVTKRFLLIYYVFNCKAFHARFTLNPNRYYFSTSLHRVYKFSAILNPHVGCSIAGLKELNGLAQFHHFEDSIKSRLEPPYVRIANANHWQTIERRHVMTLMNYFSKSLSTAIVVYRAIIVQDAMNIYLKTIF